MARDMWLAHREVILLRLPAMSPSSPVDSTPGYTRQMMRRAGRRDECFRWESGSLPPYQFALTRWDRGDAIVGPSVPPPGVVTPYVADGMVDSRRVCEVYGRMLDFWEDAMLEFATYFGSAVDPLRIPRRVRYHLDR